MADHLEEELKKTIEDCTRWARRNYVYAHAVFVTSVLGSFAASVLASGELGKAWLGDDGNRVATAVFAALPGVMLLLNNALRFEERTRWFWRKVRLAERYYRQLRDRTDPTTSSLSKAYGEDCEKLEAEWPAFGATPGQPAKPGI